jgi:hypothetical protein
VVTVEPPETPGGGAIRSGDGCPGVAGLARALLAAVVLTTLLGAPVLYLLPVDPMVRAPFVPVVVIVAGFVSYVYVYRDGPEERHTVTGPGSTDEKS